MSKDESGHGKPKMPTLKLGGMVYRDPDGRVKYQVTRKPDGTLFVEDPTKPATNQEISDAQQLAERRKRSRELPDLSPEEREGWCAIGPALLGWTQEFIEEE